MANTDVRNTQTARRTQGVQRTTRKEDAGSAATDRRVTSESKGNTDSMENIRGRKPRRRMKKQVRRTLGGLFLASAIVVAAIPTPESRAAFGPDTDKETVKVSVSSLMYDGSTTDFYNGYDPDTNPLHDNYTTDGATSGTTYSSNVPLATLDWVNDAERTVYTSGDGKFQFVYMRRYETDSDRYAVILGYSGSDTDLVIPDSIQGYKKYTDNVSSSGYCLVAKNGSFLYYLQNEQKVIANQKFYTVTFVENTTYKGTAYNQNDQLEDVGENELTTREGNLYLVTHNQRQVQDGWTNDGGITVISQEQYDQLADNTSYVAHYTTENYEVYNTTAPYMVDNYYPCYYSTLSTWEDRPNAELYYNSAASGDPPVYVRVGDNNDEYNRIEATVAYIGQEYLVNGGSAGTWNVGGVITDPSQGVFAEKSSITNLSFGPSIEGIGDFAFYGCSTLSSVSFSSNLLTIGNGAFSECINMTSCNIEPNANLLAIGKDAFYDCRSLSTFWTNTGLRALGDSCFENCTGLTNVYINGEKRDGTSDPGISTQVALQTLGNHVFRNCTSLSSITFPPYYGESVPLDVDMFEGCSSLGKIKISNTTIDFDAFHCDGYSEKDAVKGANDRWSYSAAGTFPKCVNNDWDKFLDTVPDYFYFEGPGTSAIHDTCLAESISFKYLDEDIYERKVYEIDERDATEGRTWKTAAILYQINPYGEILNAAIVNRVNADGTEMSPQQQSHPINLTIPEKIGPYGIDTIGNEAFKDNCYMTKVTIPASVSTIGDRAFEGCHKLETVIFTDATQVQSIGTDAFRTQKCNYATSATGLTCNGCHEALGDYTTEATTQANKLTFCGEMINPGTGSDTVPFMYAMNGVSKINNDDQTTEFIRYHSGWPTNLVVQYDYNIATGEGEVQLVEYPRYSSYGTSVAEAEAYCETLPYLDRDNDQATFEYYADLVYNARRKYQDYIVDPTKPAPTAREMELINAALNIVVPTNVDAIGTTIVDDGSGHNYTVGLFSGAAYDADGFPIIQLDDGTLLYTDQYDRLWTNSAKTSAFDDPMYLVQYNPYIPDAEITNTELQTITLNGVDKVEPFAYYGNTALKEVSVIGADTISDYAFDGCTKLANATLGANVQDVGIRPFRGCNKIENINVLSGNPYFSYSNGLLFRSSGDDIELVECMESRGHTNDAGNYISGQPKINSNELAAVTKIREEAFMDCDNIGNVDFSSSSVEEVPYRAFRNSSIKTVTFGSGTETISEEAFFDTPSLTAASLPYTIVSIAVDAFADTTTDPVDSYNDSAHHQNPVYISCVEGSYADKYAKSYVYLTPEYGEVYVTHYVYYYDQCPTLSSPTYLGREIVKDGEDGTLPYNAPDHTDEGYSFDYWTDYKDISMDTKVMAIYKKTDLPVYTVDFYGYLTETNAYAKLCDTQYITEGMSAVVPTPESAYESFVDDEGTKYTFTGDWNGTDDHGASYKGFECWTNINSNRTVIAKYSDNSGDASRHSVKFFSGYDGSLISSQKVNDGESAVAPQVPTISGYSFKRFIPSDFSEVSEDMTIVAYYEKDSGGGGGGGGGGGTASPDPTATATPASGGGATGLAKTYTVSVSGGSGSGNYPAGAVVAVNAYDMGTGQVFDKWTTSTAGVAFANPSSPSTSFVMPAANVAITATYRTGGSGSSSSTGSGGGSGSGSGGTATRNGSGSTTVDITKGGISNTNVAGATVSGSTDNFVVKITDDQTASEMALRALQNSYGDITRLKYLPMDISLYDSTGRTKIADTAGLSVSITMPLPTELAQYAGNNKIASVAGGTLDPLNSRFTTVDGVPCISFTATHFSPYVIWVDTGDLTESTIDYTPKTGDPIHPKWFLAIGLACISLVLFFKRDKKVKVTPA